MRGLRPRITRWFASATNQLNTVIPVLDTGISTPHAVRVKTAHVYIMANRKDGTLYVGVTSHLLKRVFEHREGLCDGFTNKYKLTRLVYFEEHDEIQLAIQREKNIKHWPRKWKVDLIERINPEWDDLFEVIAQ